MQQATVLTDEDIRMDFLVELGLKPSEARQYIKDNPKPTTSGEAFAIANERLRDFGRAITSPVAGKLAKLGGRK